MKIKEVIENLKRFDPETESTASIQTIQPVFVSKNLLPVNLKENNTIYDDETFVKYGYDVCVIAPMIGTTPEMLHARINKAKGL
jgi:hypothetical protein